MPRHNKGELVGEWELIRLLGKGGNAEVWRATRGEEIVALKILNQTRADSEPYQRFRQEIQALRRIGAHPCIMPILDVDLPNSPTKVHPAWLGMPIATPLAPALSNSSLREVVAAVAEIANTLTYLHEQFHIHHRDIKPSNLYLLNGHPTISDFGLADIPDSEDFTVAGQPLGPKFFIAYEMIADPAGAESGPSDVFSLAKTLWVLCVDQRWPPQGEQKAANEAYSIDKYRPHPLSHQLDELIERCTRHDPQERPSMKEVADDLIGWITLDDATPQQAVDLSEKWSKLREAAEPRLRQVRNETEQLQGFHTAVRKFQELIEPLHSEIRQQYPAAEFNQRRKFIDMFFYVLHEHEITNEDIRATILSGSGWNPILLAIGIAIRTRVDGDLEFGGVFYLGQTETMGGQIDSWQSELQRVPCGSIALEAKLSQLATDMQALFPSWLDKFIAALETTEA